MFEEKNSAQTQEPKDIFQEVEPTKPEAAPQPVMQQSVAPAIPPIGGVLNGMAGGPKEPLANLSQISHSSGRKFWKIFIILFIIVLVVIGAWYVYAKFFKVQSLPQNLPITPQAQTPTVPESPAVAPSESLPESSLISPENVTGSPETMVPPVTEIDTDGDGLSDTQELSLGINVNDPDTDHDGLSDRDEVVVYRTNPLNPDTDGDGYKDGEEVANNYDPLGPGRLRNLQQVLEPTSTPAQP